MKRSYEDVLSEYGNTAYDESSTIIIGDKQIINTPVKYEAVFGPQELFDCASDDAVLAIKDTTSGRIHIFTNDGWIKSGLKHERHIGTSDDQIAMRRIIKVPVWKKADKLAGKLPEVGCKAVQIQGFCEVDVLMIHNGCVVVCNSEISDSRPAVLKIDSFMELFTPLETPAEKAARLKSEWCAKAAKQLKNLEYTSTLTSIYDALLSGDLAAPKGGE